jgi:hypothetical protein
MPTNITIKNTNQRNHIKVNVETIETDPKTKKQTFKPGTATYIKPGEYTDVWVAENRKVTIQEMPT